MSIGKIINDYGQDYSPYMGSLVNHLPMAQLALYKITDDLEKVESYSKSYSKRLNISFVKKKYPKRDSLEECLGKRNLYEACLYIIKGQDKEKTLKETLPQVLNKYKFGMSSGLFHVLIRLAYGVEGYEMDKELIEEIERSLAYYVTAYREADLFTRKIPGDQVFNEMKALANNIHINELITKEDTLGKRIRALYKDDEYLKIGFIIEGTNHEKIEALLEFLIPCYLNSGNIVVLHCITGLHALIVLEEYYEDFSQSIDILTTCIVTHILAINSIEWNYEGEYTELSWRCLLAKVSEATDAHAIKLTYSACQLDKLYNIPKLKDVSLKRMKYL